MGLALFILAFGIALLLVLPRGTLLVGVSYLVFLASLAGAVSWIPYREFRLVQRQTAELKKSENWLRAAPQVIEDRLRRLVVRVRIVAWLLLGSAWVVIGMILVTARRSLFDLGALGLVPSIFTGILATLWLKERRIVREHGAALAVITGFVRHGKGRAAVYEYQVPQAGTLQGRGGQLNGFEVGMTVPILYRLYQPSESLPVPSFLFYRVAVAE